MLTSCVLLSDSSDIFNSINFAIGLDFKLDLKLIFNQEAFPFCSQMSQDQTKYSPVVFDSMAVQMATGFTTPQPGVNNLSMNVENRFQVKTLKFVSQHGF
jgi:hypothetical protein